MPSLKNFGFRRGSGILMPVSSLPSDYGIGSFGRSAYAFVDFLKKCGTRCWQVLPLNPTAYLDSPYQSPASVAGNPYFIDLELLERRGLLTKDELEGSICHCEKVDYGFLFNTRYKVLRRAYERFKTEGGKATKEYRKFVKQNGYWLADYALFMALKVHYSYAPFTTWAPEHKDAKSARALAGDFSEDCGFFEWVQFEFDTQWQALRKYANDRGILIIGDMPIYTSHDSMDVWRAPEQFCLSSDLTPKAVAGCPPDGFSPDGQLWGNPLYNWALMKEQGFSWWLDRVRANFRLYDIVRIDHFRGFAGYYSIPYGDETARGGHWESAPGIELFRTIREAFPRAKVIAEDLGFITDDVRELLRDTGFPGMKMLQFAFYDENNEYLPRTYTTENCVVYPASHDSDCVRSFCEGLSGEALERFLRECPHKKGQSRALDLIELAMASRAALAVVPMQDYLGLKNEGGRINTPSVAEGNWTWRIKKNYATPALIRRIRGMNERNRRASK